MTVNELIAELHKYPGDNEVVVTDECGELNEVHIALIEHNENKVIINITDVFSYL